MRQRYAAWSSIAYVCSVLGLFASRYPRAAHTATGAAVLHLIRDLAQLWFYLLSPASTYTTGTTVVVGGGMAAF
jgi:hypothetical protein